MELDFFPDIIKNLPAADIPLDGLNAFLLQGKQHQMLFMNFNEDTKVPEHSHEAQWGVVLDGIMELTTNGKTITLRKGDTYFIRAGQKHSARIFNGYKDVTLFNQADRYKTKDNH